VFFQFLIPGLTTVSLLESKSGFEIATIFASVVYGWDWGGVFLLNARDTFVAQEDAFVEPF
jgi:hypothetical protein